MKKESDDASKERLKKLREELDELEKKAADLNSEWQSEKLKIQRIQKLKEELDAAKSELEIVQRDGNLARAGELKYAAIPELEKNLKQAEKE